VTGSLQGVDLDQTPAVDECLACGFIGFDCICDPGRPHRRPTPEELERARLRRLARVELAEKGEV
jgi:hypothetical protein